MRDDNSVRETQAAPLGRRWIEGVLTNYGKRQVEAELDVDDDLSLLELSLFLDSVFFGSLFDSDAEAVFEPLSLLLDELSLFLDSLLDSADAWALFVDELSLLVSDDDFEPLPLLASPFCPLRA